MNRIKINIQRALWITLILLSANNLFSQTSASLNLPASTTFRGGDSLTTLKKTDNFKFAKSVSANHSTPQNTINTQAAIVEYKSPVPDIEPVSKSGELKVFPNPTSGILKIEFKDHYEMCHLKLIDIVGKVVYSEKLTDIHPGIKTYEFSSLRDGIYIARLILTDHEVVFRVIIRK